MELEKFVTNTLISIVEGVKNANGYFKKENKEAQFWLDYGKDNEVKFDIAITVSEESKKFGGGGIKVYAINIGGEKGKSDMQENISRIKFTVKPDSIIS